MLRFTPGSAQLVAGRGASEAGGGNVSIIHMSDEAGVRIESTQPIHIESGNTLTIQAAEEKVEQTAFARFPAQHKAGEADYTAYGGSEAPDATDELLKHIGKQVGPAFQSGQPFYRGNSTGLAEQAETKMAGSGGLKRAAPRQAKADEQKEGPPQGRLVLLGAENCRLQVERSEIELTPELVKITTPVFRELGFQKAQSCLRRPNGKRP